MQLARAGCLVMVAACSGGSKPATDTAAPPPAKTETAKPEATVQPTAPASAERRATVRIDSDVGGKGFQGVWLEFAGGKKWVIDYRPREVWKSFENEVVLVAGDCYQPFGQAISAVHFRVDRLRFAAPNTVAKPLVEVGPEVTMTGMFVEIPYAAGSKRAGDKETMFRDAGGKQYGLFGVPEDKIKLGRQVRVRARHVKQNMAYVAGTGDPQIWMFDIRDAKSDVDDGRHGPSPQTCPA